MPKKKKLQASPALLQLMREAVFAHGYRKLTMERVAEHCDLSRRAIYFYFSSKLEVFRAVVRFGNDEALSTGFAAGRKRLAEGGDAVEILSDIINVRYGDTRRIANALPHGAELAAEVFARCDDIVRDVAVYFESELAKIIIELEDDGLLQLRSGVTAKQLADAIANGARGVNQRLPPVPPEELEKRYREMCRFVLYGAAEMGTISRRTTSPKARKHA
jgi:AcrR family transcriptional regulator